MVRILFIVPLVFLFSCVSDLSGSSEEHAAVNSAIQVSKKTDTLINVIFGPETGVFRGFEWGDELERVEKTESLERFEKLDNRLSYSFETKTYEMVDIQYNFDADKGLSAIKIDVFLNTDTTNAETRLALEQYLTVKYGAPKLLPDSCVWHVDRFSELSLKNIASKLDKGFQLNYRKLQ